MRDVNGNVIPINSLKDGRGHPIVPVGLSPQEPGTVEDLKATKAKLVEVQKELDDLKEEHHILHGIHDEVLKDIGTLSDSHSELQGRHEKMVEAHVELLKQTSDADEAHAPVIPIKGPVPVPDIVEPEADPTPETYGEPFPLDQEKAPSAVV